MENHINTSFKLILLSFVIFPSRNHAQKPDMSSNYTDMQSLLTFKSHITSDPSTVLESWNSNISFCSWRGVSCIGTTQRVTGIDLKNLGLVGTLPPHIGNLSFLGSLHLGGNKLSGKVPQETGSLLQLQILNLSSNSFEGAIPTSLGYCSQLITFDLSSNNLEGRIPFELGQLTKLNILDVSHNFVTGPIPVSLSNLSELTSIILKQNTLTGKIPGFLGDLHRLVNIDLRFNHLDGDIPPSIFNLSLLTQLALTKNNISGTLPSDMFIKLENLNFLLLDYNQFSGTIPESLGNATNLIRADFSKNIFMGHIPLLWNLPKIEVLNFEVNQLTSDKENGWDFLTSLENSRQLRVLALAVNQLTGKLPSTVGNLSRNLTHFMVAGNQLEGSLPAELGNLINLIILSVDYNSFSGKIPSTIGNLKHLQRLYLFHNRFSGEIPESLGNLTSLVEMALLSNSLSGTIPSSLANLNRLEQLDLSLNMLSGEIPAEIFDLPNFSLALNLSHNSLHGHIPKQIGKLKMMQAIDLSSNRFTGDIPLSVGDCSTLEYLNLSHNSFHGKVPSTIGNMRGIMSIDLSSNNLSGQIPDISLESLQFLQYLDLSVNQLEGSIPTEGIFTNTTAVSLSKNPHLCGGNPKFHLPECSSLTSHHTKEHNRSIAKLIVGLVVGLVAALFLLGVSIIIIFRRRKQPKQKKTLAALDGTGTLSEGNHKLFSYYVIKSATKSFSQQNLIGQGSFGSVYRAVFSDGTIAAVKVFKLERKGASKSFVSECEALRNVRHRNLVKIISVCSSGTFKAVIIPLMPNGSLDQWIHPKSDLQEKARDFSLKQRLKIAGELASAMQYLHYDCGTPIVHCDLKPNNILLDMEMTAYVADFGIARILGTPNELPTSSNYSTLALKGSIGYIAPEYGLGGDISTKGDVYSFGMLLLEMFTGKRPTDEEFTGTLDLQGYVTRGLPDNVIDIMDPILTIGGWNTKNSNAMITILDIGLRCAAKSPDARPTMRDVSSSIKTITATPPSTIYTEQRDRYITQTNALDDAEDFTAESL